MTIRDVLESLLLGVTLNGILTWSVLRLCSGLSLGRVGATRVGDWIDRLTACVILAAALVVLIVTAGGIAGILDQPALLLLPAGLVAVTIGWWSRSTPPCR